MSNKIREAIKARLETVVTPQVGKVHLYERYSKNEPKFRELFTIGKSVLGFFVRRVRAQESISSSTKNKVTITWEIRGYASFDDEAMSELNFDNLVDEIRNAFRKEDTLGGLVDNLGEDTVGIQLDDSGPVMFARILCHSVRLSLTTNHYAEIGIDDAEFNILSDFNHSNVNWDIPPHDINNIDAVDSIKTE